MRYYLVVFESANKKHYRITENERDLMSARILIGFVEELEKEVDAAIVLTNIVELRERGEAMKCHICNQDIKDMDGSVVCHTACVALAELEATTQQPKPIIVEFEKGTISLSWLLEAVSVCFVALDTKRKDLEVRITELEAAESKPKKKCDACGEDWSPRHFWHCKGSESKPEPDPEKRPNKPEPTEFIKQNRLRIDRDAMLLVDLSKLSKSALRVIAQEALEHLGEACERLESQAEQFKRLEANFDNLIQINNENIDRIDKLREQLAKMERMVEIPGLLKDGFLAVGQELIRRDMLIATAKKEIERLKQGFELYIILRDRERFTPQDVLEKIGEFTGNKYEAGYLISSIRRDLEKALKDGE